jgi:hypothetical protein
MHRAEGVVGSPYGHITFLTFILLTTCASLSIATVVAQMWTPKPITIIIMNLS